MSFTVAIVGRPNVGKSTLFNRLVGKKLALVDDTPGVTRDRRPGDAKLIDLKFRIIDTAGLEEAAPETLQGRMRAQTEAAIDEANATAYGLNASVWTKDGRRGRAVAARLRAGTVNVNEGYASAYGSVQSPMGGMKDSGLGRRHGSEGILKYTEAQTVAQQRVLPMAPSFGMDDEKYAQFMSTSLKAMKALRLR